MVQMNLSIFNSNTEQRVFWYKILSFGLGLILIAYILVALLRTFGLLDQASQLFDSPNQWEVLTLGNSHNVAIDIDTIGVNGYHLWRGGEDFFQSHHKMRQFVPRLPNLHTVIITASYFTWYQENQASEHNFLYEKLYYLSPFGKIMRDDNWKGVVVKLLSPQRTYSIMPDGQRISGKYLDCKHPEKSELIYTSSPKGAMNHYKIQTDSIAKRPDVHIAAYDALVGIVEYLQAQNIRVVFYTPPYFYRYTELYNPDTIAYAHRSMERLQAEYDVEYYDYSIDKKFIYDHTLFWDANHLNLCGAKKFSANFRTVLFGEEK